jgi:diguanylate cyclase (GGDEF)-like protein
MLEFFLGAAEEFFESGPKPGDSLSSGLWVENLDSGEEMPLVATARVLKNSQLLLVQAMREEYAQRVRLLRRSLTDFRSRADLAAKRKITQSLMRSSRKNNPFDPLTTLYNREAFMALLKTQIAKLSIYAPNLGLIMMSLDQFESQGKPNTKDDNLLRQLGQILQRTMRKSDAAVHYGDGVFFIVSPGASLPQSTLAAERIGKAITGYDFGLGRPLDLYLGCTVYRPGEEAKEFINRTRQALLDAAKVGPNKVGQRAPT